MAREDSTTARQAAAILTGLGIEGRNQGPAWRRKSTAKQTPSERQAAKILGPVDDQDDDEDEYEDDDELEEDE
jgi:hypothetical protein